MPATPAGLHALEDLTAAGLPVNALLIATPGQHLQACAASWRGARRSADARRLKSVFTVSISEIDVYAAYHVPTLSGAACQQAGAAIGKKIWQLNEQFWADKGLPRRQEVVFAGPSVERSERSTLVYLQAIAGADMESDSTSVIAALGYCSEPAITRPIDRPDQKFVYGYIWVTISWVLRHASWGTIGLPLLARMYVRRIDLPKILHLRRPVFRTKIEQTVELLEWAAGWLKWLKKPIWVVVDGFYGKTDFLRAARTLDIVVVGRLRRDAALWTFPFTSPANAGASRSMGKIAGA